MADKELNGAPEQIEETTETVENESVVEETKADDTTAATDTTKTKKDKKAKENKKPGFFARVGGAIKKFWRTMKSELKKVTWYSRKQTFTSTLLVLVCMGVAAAVIGLLDVGFSMGIEGLAHLFG